jgi:hypothetical protein
LVAESSAKDEERVYEAGFMKRFFIIGTVLTVILMSPSCSGLKKSPEEEKVLNALSFVQESLESNISYEQFVELLDQAKIEFDILRGDNEQNPCFMQAVEKCLASYTTSEKAWKRKMEATEDARRQDMDLTLSVMQSFAALSIQRANKCFEN